MIPVNRPIFNGNEGKYLQECIETGWVSSEGPFIRKFESSFSEYIGRKYGVALANGSAALDVAIKALELPEGSEVIMPTFTIISPAASLLRLGLKPVLIDSISDSWNMDVDSIEKKITKKTSAILVVHIYGLPVDMNKVLELAEKYNLKIIEDAAEMHGQTYHDKKCGSFGDISTFSFYPNKHITTGEGGMILTDNKTLAERCHYYKNLCFQSDRRYVHHELGWNYRMTNMQAALGLAQLENIKQHIERKREIGKLYNKWLSPVEELIQLPLEKTEFAKNIYWVYGLVAKTEEQANSIQNQLKIEKIGTRPFFWCMHEQPIFRKKEWFKGEKYPIAEKIARRGFYIPSGLGLSNEEIKIVSDRLLKAIHESI